MSLRHVLAACAASGLLCAVPSVADAAGMSLKDAAAAVAQTTFLDKPVTLQRKTTEKGGVYYMAFIDGTDIFAMIGLGCVGVGDTGACEGIGFYSFNWNALGLASMSTFNDDARGAKLYKDADDGTSSLVLEQVATGASAPTIRDQVLWMEAATVNLVQLFESQKTTVSFSAGEPVRAAAGETPLAALRRFRAEGAPIDADWVSRKAAR